MTRLKTIVDNKEHYEYKDVIYYSVWEKSLIIELYEDKDLSAMPKEFWTDLSASILKSEYFPSSFEDIEYHINSILSDY